MNLSTFKGYLLLFLTAFLWGMTFLFQKSATQHVDAINFVFWRFLVASIAMLSLVFLPKPWFLPNADNMVANVKLHQKPLVIGLASGCFMFVGMYLQQLGLSYTTTGKSGFFTSLYIIIVPFLARCFGQRFQSEAWLGVLLTFIGIYFLGNSEGHTLESQFNRGDVLTLISAFAWAGQVLLLSLLARYANVLHIAIVQMLTVTLLAFIVSLLMSAFGHQAFAGLSVIWQIKYELLFAGIVSSAIAFTLQIIGQRYLPATNAALVMSTEAIFALLAGIVFLGRCDHVYFDVLSRQEDL